MRASEAEVYLDAITSALRARSVSAPRSPAEGRRKLVQRFADSVMYVARDAWARSAPFPKHLVDIALDGVHLAAIRLAHASDQLLPAESDRSQVGGSTAAMAPVVDLPVADRVVIAEALVARYEALHRAIGPDDALLLSSPVLVMSATDVLNARRANPEADDRMVARAVTDFPLRLRRTLTAMTTNYRMMAERNLRLGVGLTDDELRDLAAYRVPSTPHEWADPVKELGRLRRQFRDASEQQILSDELLRYILVFRTGDEAAAEVERFRDARHELRRKTMGYVIPDAVYLTALRRSLDMYEAVHRIELFRLHRLVTRTQHRRINAADADRIAIDRVERLEPIMRDPERRIAAISSLELTLRDPEMGVGVR